MRWIRDHIFSRASSLLTASISIRPSVLDSVMLVLLFPNALADLPEPVCHYTSDAEEH
jgi:hypothetical protein